MDGEARPAAPPLGRSALSRAGEADRRLDEPQVDPQCRAELPGETPAVANGHRHVLMAQGTQSSPSVNVTVAPAGTP